VEVTFDGVGGWSYWWLAGVVNLLAISWACCRAPWLSMIANGQRQRAFGVAIVGLAIFWQLEVEVEGLLTLHPLMMMSVVMVFGFELAVIVGVAAVVLAAAIQNAITPGLVMPMCFNVVVPAAAATLVLKVIAALPTRNLFVYMLGGGFFGAMITVQSMAVTQWLYIAVFGPPPLLVIASDYHYLSLLMMFPEGFINGALMTVLTVLSPELVKTYDDHRYLDDQ
tara:strand:- start:42293 stop:42964 length:672 start_codon:yes stop_codon:yes gene_type:complete